MLMVLFIIVCGVDADDVDDDDSALDCEGVMMTMMLIVLMFITADVVDVDEDVDDDENALFVVLPKKKAIRKLNLISKRLLGTIEVGDGSYAVVLMGER